MRSDDDGGGSVADSSDGGGGVEWLVSGRGEVGGDVVGVVVVVSGHIDGRARYVGRLCSNVHAVKIVLGVVFIIILVVISVVIGFIIIVSIIVIVVVIILILILIVVVIAPQITFMLLLIFIPFRIEAVDQSIPIVQSMCVLVPDDTIFQRPVLSTHVLEERDVVDQKRNNAEYLQGAQIRWDVPRELVSAIPNRQELEDRRKIDFEVCDVCEVGQI